MDVELIIDVPTGLNESLIKGEIDLGPISSFSYYQHSEKFHLLPDLSISAHGQVGSILLFSRHSDLSKLHGGNIVVTKQSSTSTNLLRVLLAKFYKCNANFKVVSNPLTHISSADAVLLIGDDAIMARDQLTKYHFFDLSHEWFKQTGHSMTFALWVVRSEKVTELKKEITIIKDRLLIAKKNSKTNMCIAIEKARERLGGTKEFWHLYFQGLIYDFSPQELAGLKLFYQYAIELGMLPSSASFRCLSYSQSMFDFDKAPKSIHS